jgi:hypothetical protein
MLGLSRTLAIVALSAALWSAQQPQTGAIAGRVTDPFGGVLPGVTVTVTGPGAPRKVVTSRNGDYTADNLPAGSYRIEMYLPGFRRAVTESVRVENSKSTTHDVTLRLGLLSIVDYMFPADGVPGALREADVVVHVRLTRSVGVRVVNDILIVTDHDATVLGVVKADDAGIASGSSIRFAQDNSGRWAEDGYQAVGIERPYEPGESFVAFLMRQKDASLGEFRGAGYMWPVKQGFVIVANPAGGTLPAALRTTMPLDQCLAALRKLLAAKNP